MPLTIARVTRLGAAAPGASTAPINSFARLVSSWTEARVEKMVRTLVLKRKSNRRNASGFRSMR